MNINCETKLITKIIFGENVVAKLGDSLKNAGYKNVMFLYGGGSIKKIGLHEQIIKQLKAAKINFVEVDGVRPNPYIGHADEAVKVGKAKQVDAILAVGGGSVIDEAKCIGLGITNTHIKSTWDLWSRKVELKNDCLPIIAFITLAATGSENNAGSVMTEEKTQEKFGFGHDSCIPVMAFEDPTVTYSINKWHTSCGSFDMFTHCFEKVISTNLLEWTQNYLIANMKTAVNNSLIALKKPNNLIARSNLLITSSMALNEISEFANADGDWTTHNLEHGFSALYDMSHGAGLALVLPYFLRENKKNKLFKTRVEVVGKEVFNVKGFDQTVKAIEKWIKSLGLFLKVNDFKNLSKKIDKKNDIEWLVNHYKARLVVNGQKGNDLKMGDIVKTDLKTAKKLYTLMYK